MAPLTTIKGRQLSAGKISVRLETWLPILVSMMKRKSKLRRRSGYYTKEQAGTLRFRQFIGRRVTVNTDRQTHALVATYARWEDLNMQDAVTRLLGYGLSVVLAQREAAEKERTILEILMPVDNR